MIEPGGSLPTSNHETLYFVFTSTRRRQRSRRPYGSNGRLRGAEAFRNSQFGSNILSNHELAHTWGDYWDWDALTGHVMGCWVPGSHSPLFYPGASMVNSVLNPRRQVGEQAAVAATAHGPAFEVQRSPVPQTFHPTLLHRMGLISKNDVPPMLVFENQSQFSENFTEAPDTGTAIQGAHMEIHLNDIEGRHGVVSGPPLEEFRRATVVVSRDGLLSPELMNYWNHYAARHGAAEGTRNWSGTRVVRGDRQPTAAPDRHRSPTSAHDPASGSPRHVQLSSGERTS